MAGTDNFQIFNPNATNQENDAAYLADSLRTNGAPTDGICPSPTFNKFAYQQSIFAKAFADMLANKGYSPNDGSAAPGSALANLVNVFANVMTQADMAVFARLLSPIFTGVPQAPTPAPGDNSTKIATTAFVTALLSLGFTFLASVNGYFKFPSALGGFVLQWAVGFSIPANQPSTAASQTINFPIRFPTACLFTNVSSRVGDTSGNWDGAWQCVGAPTVIGQLVNWQAINTSLSGAGTAPLLLAFGY